MRYPKIQRKRIKNKWRHMNHKIYLYRHFIQPQFVQYKWRHFAIPNEIYSIIYDGRSEKKDTFSHAMKFIYINSLSEGNNGKNSLYFIRLF